MRSIRVKYSVMYFIWSSYRSVCYAIFPKAISLSISWLCTYFCIEYQYFSFKKVITRLQKIKFLGIQIVIISKGMSHIIYGQNKVICFIDLSKQLRKNGDKYLGINELILTVHHFHYPCVYYERVFTHFKNLLPENTTYRQIRLNYKGQQLPSDLPIGLFVQNDGQLTVSISEFQISDPYNIIKQRWKQAFTGINPLKGNYYIARQLGQAGLRKKLQLYFNGQSHNLQKEEFEGYEGTNIVTRFFIEGEVIQRRSQTGENKTVSDLIREQMPLIEGKKYTVKSHGIEFNLQMNLKQFLDEWSYNDGFCYLKIDILQ